MSLGFVIPMLIWALPAAAILSYQQKHIAMVLWHAFPFSTPLLQNSFIGAIKNRSPSRDSAMEQVWSLRRVYAYAVLIATIPRIVSLALSFATVLSPTLFWEEYVAMIGPRRFSFRIIHS